MTGGLPRAEKWCSCRSPALIATDIFLIFGDNCSSRRGALHPWTRCREASPTRTISRIGRRDTGKGSKALDEVPGPLQRWAHASKLVAPAIVGHLDDRPVVRPAQSPYAFRSYPGECRWRVSSANWRQSLLQTLSATPA